MRPKSRFAVLCAVLFSAVTAFAAPSVEERLNALREQGKREGWTFEVGDTPLMHNPIPEGYDHRLARRELDKIAYVIPPKLKSLPARWSWQDQGMVSPVKDQAFPQYCGSCWAFGTVAVVESLIKIATGHEADLSEQQVVSCSNYGSCNGGNFAFGYYKKTGAVSEAEFPYKAADVSCKSGLAGGEKIKSYSYIGERGRSPTVDEIKSAIYTYGPVAVTVSASGAWSAYKGGVYNACNTNGTNHIVALVGYDDNEQAWILKNSHGTQWGDQGFMHIRYTGSNGYKCNNVGQEAVFAVYR